MGIIYTHYMPCYTLCPFGALLGYHLGRQDRNMISGVQLSFPVSAMLTFNIDMVAFMRGTL
jgi:hypothetical protein